ncbi:hypothetical protein T265_12120, partial [Opisthorchis viverrini]
GLLPCDKKQGHFRLWSANEKFLMLLRGMFSI